MSICYVCKERIDCAGEYYILTAQFYPAYPKTIEPNAGTFELCPACYGRWKARKVSENDWGVEI